LKAVDSEVNMVRKRQIHPWFVEILAGLLFFISLILLLAAPSPNSASLPALYTIAAEGGQESVFLKEPSLGYRYAVWSPDGRQIVFNAAEVDPAAWPLYLADAKGTLRRPLLNNSKFNYQPVWSPDGSQLALVTWGMNGLGTTELHILDVDSGTDRRLIETDPNDESHPSWSPDGKRLVYNVGPVETSQIYMVNADGTGTHAIAAGLYPTWSPQGDQIAFLFIHDGRQDIFVMNSDGGTRQRLTDNGRNNSMPAWSPDGQRIAFLSANTDEAWHIWVMNADGSDPHDLMPVSKLSATLPSWSPDGGRIIFSAVEFHKARDRRIALTAQLRMKVIATTVLWLVVLFLADRRIRLQRPALQPAGSVQDAIRELQIVQNPVLKWTFRIMPWLLILATLIGLTAAFRYYPPVLRYFLRQDLFYYSGIGTAGISLLIFQILLQRIPEAFRSLWNRNAIVARGALPETSVDEQYRGFMEELGRRLNHPRQFVIGVVCGLLGAAWVFNNFNTTDLATVATSLADPDFIVQFLIGFSIGYIVGLQVWRMIVVGYEIGQIGKKFDIALQLGHPDGCAGLAPLGNLCLWNALIICPAGIDLGCWLIFGDTGYQGLLYILLFVVMVIASVSFFVPLRNIHHTMVIKRDLIRQQLDQLGENMNQLARRLLEQASELDAAESEKIAKKLERMRQTYAENQRIPTWPFDTKTLVQFITSQIVPLLSLTGLGQPIKDIVFRLVDFLK